MTWEAVGGTGSWPRLVGALVAAQRGGVPRALPEAGGGATAAISGEMVRSREVGRRGSIAPTCRVTPSRAGPARGAPPPPRGNRAVADGDRAGGVVPSPESRS